MERRRRAIALVLGHGVLWYQGSVPPDPNNPYPMSAYGPPPGRPPNDDLAWAGIASSVASWLTCCCAPVPLIGAFIGLGGLLLSIAGIACGVIAYRTAVRTGGRTDLSIVAIAIGALRLVLTAGFVVLVIVLIGTAGIAGYMQQAGH